MTRSPSRGFGLLEAIVALALLAGTGVALFAWIQQNTDAAVRLRRADDETQLRLAAQSIIETVNPMLSPESELELGGLRVQWRAVPIETPRRNRAYSGDVPGLWLVGLYRLDVTAIDRSKDVRVAFVQWRIGRRRVIDSDTEAPAL